MRSFFRQPFLDVLAALERLATIESAPTGTASPPDSSRMRRSRDRSVDPRGLRVLVVPFATLIVTWWVYVPIHELLHVLGCVATGGAVTRLELSARYGAGLLSKVFPFVVSGSDYAGQLKGFDTKGSDLCYLATDFLPFVLSIVIGVPLMKLAGRRRRPVVFGMAIVLGLAPFYNLSGDYFEMASILTTRSMTLVSTPGETGESGEPAGPVFEKLRSDDVFRLVSDFVHDPAKLGLTTWRAKGFAVVVMGVSAALAVLLSFGTYWAGHGFYMVCRPRPTPNAPSVL